MSTTSTPPLHVPEAVQILAGTPQVLRSLIPAAPVWFDAREREDSWSPREVVSHLIHCEQEDWVPRVQRILEHGETVPFEPFQREDHGAHTAGMDFGDLLGTFERLRGQNIDFLEVTGIGAPQLGLTGTHPDLGRVTLGELIATWVAHDLAHVGQISRVLASRYRDAVGPWNQPDYLRILNAG